MNDAALVGGGEAGADLAGDFGGLVRREPTNAADDRVEIFPVDVFHGKKRGAVGIADIEDATHVGMGNLARNADFGMKSRESGFILRERLGKKLDSHDLAELQIFGSVDLTHPTPAGDSHNAIALSNHLSRGKASSADGVGAAELSSSAAAGRRARRMPRSRGGGWFARKGSRRRCDGFLRAAQFIRVYGSGSV